jgi:hypothetical protein
LPAPNPLETLSIYKKVDVDRNIKDQINIHSKKKDRPATVSTINKMNLAGMIGEAQV